MAATPFLGGRGWMTGLSSVPQISSHAAYWRTFPVLPASANIANRPMLRPYDESRHRRPNLLRRVSEYEELQREMEETRELCSKESQSVRHDNYSLSVPPRNPSPVQQEAALSTQRLPYSKAVENFLQNPRYEITTAALIIVSIVVVAFETLPDIGELGLTLANIENLICLFFALEYIARWYSKNLNPTYVFQPLAIIDLISFSPLVLGAMMLAMDFKMGILGGTPEETAMRLAAEESLDAGPLTFLKLLRIIRLQRFLRDYDSFKDLEIALGLKPSQIRPYQLQLARVILSLATLYFISTGLIYVTESGVNPDIPDFFSAMYFGLTTLTTVGFGDIAPVTPEGKLVVCLAIILGVTIIPVQLGSLADAFMLESQTKDLSFTDLNRICEKCGVRSHRSDARFCWQCGERMLTPGTEPKQRDIKSK